MCESMTWLIPSLTMNNTHIAPIKSAMCAFFVWNGLCISGSFQQFIPRRLTVNFPSYRISFQRMACEVQRAVRCHISDQYTYYQKFSNSISLQARLFI